ncbi:MAG TPA: chemotaxis protein CheB [Candidatus Angelobacter sp.]|nr:chemotaxis protein CheB [Candidatus Angelobacter sp.]
MGGSAGAVERMQQLVRCFPRDLPAAVFIVLHVSAEDPGLLPAILSRAGPLPAKHPRDREAIRSGQIYVAPSDRHLTIEDGVVRVMRGPRENRHRPAIDPLFRTAARVGGARVIGVVLSGRLDDGTAGLHAIRRRGGVALVQDPADAASPQMPESALKYGGADFVLPASALGPKIVELVCRRGMMKETESSPESVRTGNENLRVSAPDEGSGTPSVFACPECHGVLWELKEGELVRFRCRVGHAFTTAHLAEEQRHHVEASLWAAERALEEKAALATRISDAMPDTATKQRFMDQADADRKHADVIKEMLFAVGE